MSQRLEHVRLEAHLFRQRHVVGPVLDDDAVPVQEYCRARSYTHRHRIRPTGTILPVRLRWPTALQTPPETARTDAPPSNRTGLDGEVGPDLSSAWSYTDKRSSRDRQVVSPLFDRSRVRQGPNALHLMMPL